MTCDLAFFFGGEWQKGKKNFFINSVLFNKLFSLYSLHHWQFLKDLKNADVHNNTGMKWTFLWLIIIVQRKPRGMSHLNKNCGLKFSNFHMTNGMVFPLDWTDLIPFPHGHTFLQDLKWRIWDHCSWVLSYSVISNSVM